MRELAKKYHFFKRVVELKFEKNIRINFSALEKVAGSEFNIKKNYFTISA